MVTVFPYFLHFPWTRISKIHNNNKVMRVKCEIESKHRRINWQELERERPWLPLSPTHLTRTPRVAAWPATGHPPPWDLHRGERPDRSGHETAPVGGIHGGGRGNHPLALPPCAGQCLPLLRSEARFTSAKFSNRKRQANLSAAMEHM